MLGLARSATLIKASARRVNTAAHYEYSTPLRTPSHLLKPQSTAPKQPPLLLHHQELAFSPFPRIIPLPFSSLSQPPRHRPRISSFKQQQNASHGTRLIGNETAFFVVFGFAYLGGFQWWLMVHKYRQWFPTMDRFAKLSLTKKLQDTAGILDAMKMVVFDVVVHLPMIYFPTYYTVKELVGGHSWNPINWATEGVTKYSRNLKEDLTAMVQLWGPSDCVQFILPVHIRMPFRHLVSFFWTAYVSFTRGAIDEDEDQELLQTAE